MGYCAFATTTEIGLAVFTLWWCSSLCSAIRRYNTTSVQSRRFRLFRPLSELAFTRSRGEIDQKLAKKWQQQDTTIFPVSITPNTTTFLASRGYNTTSVQSRPFRLFSPLSELAFTRSRGEIDQKIAKIRPTQCHTHPSTTHSNTPTWSPSRGYNVTTVQPQPFRLLIPLS
jgi:hypothetical protein